jgi:glucokinase
MTEIVVLDIGGTNARFAIATLEDGRVVGLDHIVTLHTAEHASLQLARDAYAEHLGRPLPREAGIAIAGPVHGEVLQLTNNPWVIRPALITEKLGFDRYVLVNDFGAVAYAVDHVGPEMLTRLCGPDTALPSDGVISVIGPGTGLGVAQLVRRDGRALVIETEGGHIDFAPLDPLEDAMLARIRRHFRRVSVERIVSGPGLANLYAALADIEGKPVATLENTALWTLALAGEDSLAAAAFDRFCLTFGSVAGDVALAHGADAVVVAGGLGQRIAGRLPQSGFERRFRAKGRFETRMAETPVKLITHPQPGLFGAAAAFIARYP